MSTVVRTGLIQSIGNVRQSLKDFGTCLDFTAGGQIDLGTDNVFDNDFYWAGWVKWYGNNGAYQHIFAKRDSYASDGMMFDFHLNDSTDILSLDTNVGSFASGKKLLKNKWMHVVWVHNKTESLEQIYFNGEKVYGVAIKTLGTGTGALVSIGSVESGESEPFNGLIDEIAIGNSAPTWEEVVDMYAKYKYPSSWSVLHLDEGSGATATDSSGNENDGTISNAIYATQKVLQERSVVSYRPSAIPGKSISFNGTSSNIVAGTANPGNSITIGGWAKWGGTTGTYQSLIAKRSSYGASTMAWQIYLDYSNSHRISFIGNAGVGKYWIGYLPQNVWTHWAISGTSGGSFTLYLNAVSQGLSSGVIGFGSKTDSPISIGSNDGGTSEFYKGNQDEVFICDAILSINDIKNMMKRNYESVSNKFALWKFDEGSGSVAIDSAGSNTGTISSASYSTDVPFQVRTAI